MKEVVWVFGNSAAGKETFIYEVLRDEKLAERLGWVDMSITLCQISINEIIQSELRDRIIVEAPELFANYDIVLVKWQYLDSKNQRLQQLKKLADTATHRIVLLQAGKKELVKRLSQKSWWHDYGKEEEFIDRENRIIVKSIAELSNFPVTKISSSSGDNYNVLGSD